MKLPIFFKETTVVPNKCIGSISNIFYVVISPYALHTTCRYNKWNIFLLAQMCSSTSDTLIGMWVPSVAPMTIRKFLEKSWAVFIKSLTLDGNFISVLAFPVNTLVTAVIPCLHLLVLVTNHTEVFVLHKSPRPQTFVCGLALHVTSLFFLSMGLTSHRATEFHVLEICSTVINGYH